MSWVDLRRRSQDPESALLSDLINQKIQSEAQENIVDNIENFIPISEVASKTIRNDALFYAATKPYTQAYDVFLPREPDYNYLRLWFKNDHGGNYLTDYSKCDNIIEIHSDPLSVNPDDPDVTGNVPREPPLTLIGSQDFNITPNQIANYFTSQNNHYIRVLDNPNVRIKEIAATADGFTVFTRFYITSTNNEANTGRRSVIFSKLDSEQVDYAYEAQLADDGSLYWFVRQDYAEFSLKAANAITFVDELDYAAEDYDATDYSADLSAPPEIPTFLDFAFNFNFTTKRMQIIKDGTIIADSNDSGYTTNCVAKWSLNEGADMAESARTVIEGFNENDGIITNATWTSDHYLRFDPTDASAIDYVLVAPSATINSYAGAITVSMWICPVANPTGGNVFEFITKNGTNNGSFQIVMNGTNTQLAATVKNDTGTSQSATVNGSFGTLGAWYHVVLSWAAGGRVNIYVNNVKTQSGSTLSGTLSTGTTPLYMGSPTSGKTPNCKIDDVAIWTRALSDAEVTSLYNQGHPLSSFPIYQVDPPEPGESPVPITNPFSQLYSVALPEDLVNQSDFIKLHLKGLGNLEQFYNIADGVIHHGQGTFTNPVETIYTVNDASSGGVGTALYDLAGTNHHTDVDKDTTSRVGIKLGANSPLTGKIISRITVRLRTGGTGPTGVLKVGIRKANDSFVQFGSNLDVSSMPDDGTDRNYTFDLLSNTYALANGDRITCETSNINSGGRVEVKKHQDGGVNGITMQDWDGNSWSDESSGYQLAATIYENSTSAAYSSIYYTSPGGHFYDAIYVNTANSPLIGKKLTSASFLVNRVGAITGGNITCTIIKGGGGTVTLGTPIAGSGISVSDQTITFTNRNQSYALANGDRIALSMSAAGSDSTHYIQVKHVITSSFTGACEQTGTSAPAWTNLGTNDLIGTLEAGGDTVTDPDVQPWVSLNDNIKRVGIFVATGSALIGKVISQVSARLLKVGDPTGNISVVIRNASDAIVASFGNIDADADLSDTVQSKNFTNTNNKVALAANFLICVEYSGGSSADYVNMIIQLNIDGANVYDTNKTYLKTWNGSAYTTTAYDFSGGLYTGGGPTDPSGRTRGFEYVGTDASALKNKKITKVVVYLQKVGVISIGTIYVRIRKFAGDGIAGTIGTINAADVTTDIAAYTVTNTSQQYSLGTGDKVTVEFTGGDDNNYIKLITTKNDAFDGTINSFFGYFDDPIYYSNITEDLVGELWIGGDTYTPAGDEIPEPRGPYYTHDLLVLAGGDDWGYSSAPRNYLAAAVIMPEFRFERMVWTAAMATNIKTNGCSTSAIPAGKVAKCGYFVIHA